MLRLWNRKRIHHGDTEGTKIRCLLGGTFGEGPINLGPNSNRQDTEVDALARDVENAIATGLSAEYDRVDDVLSRLSSFARSLVIEHGSSTHFWETTADNKPLSRLDLAISQLLDLEVIRCVQVDTDSGLAYTWTYLGRQCVLRLGAQPGAALSAGIESPPSVTVDLSSYEAVTKELASYDVVVDTVGIPLPNNEHNVRNTESKKPR